MKPLPERLESDRLSIRCAAPGDARALYDGVLETLAELRAWGSSLPWALAEPSVQASERYCRESQGEFRAGKSLPMLLWLKTTGEFVGCCGLHGLDGRGGRLEIGYWCRRHYQGLGLMSEAVRSMTALALGELGATRVDAIIDTQNRASRRVCEAAGYRLAQDGNEAPGKVRYMASRD